MIVDIHAHYTRAPAQLDAFRGRQITRRNRPDRDSLNISDDLIASSLHGNIKQMKERGIDRLMFSPRASGMGHDFGDELISRYWTEANNDLIGRIAKIFPEQFSAVCQLPQTPGVSPANCIEELERCVLELGFVGCNINPDVSGGVQPFTPSLGSEWWYPLWEKMVELDVPGMVHASSTLNPALDVNGSHYVNMDTTAVVELCRSKVFDDFPTLKLIIPHGGGSVPYQFSRHRALNQNWGAPPFEEQIRKLYFDMALYDQDSMEMLIRRVGADRVLYSSEMFGTAKCCNSHTGKPFDDTLGMVHNITSITDAEREMILGGNAKRVYSRVSNW
jgi:4-oxalmesaconate hydratase